jgi:hypothetical protein
MVQDAIGQPDPARLGKGPIPGRPLRTTSWAPEAGPHAQMEFWYRKALTATEDITKHKDKEQYYPQGWRGYDNKRTTDMVAALSQLCKIADERKEILPQHPGAAPNNCDQQSD